jgi:hypothetical protein
MSRARHGTKRRGRKVRRNVTKRGGGLIGYLKGLFNPNPNPDPNLNPDQGYEMTPMQPLTTQMALKPTTRTNEGTTQLQQPEFQQPQLPPGGTTYNGPNGGKRRGRRNRKRTHRGGGVSVSPYEAPMNAAPISNIQMAQPLTMVGGKSKKKRHSGKRH